MSIIFLHCSTPKWLKRSLLLPMHIVSHSCYFFLGSPITRPFWTSWMRWTTMRARGSWSLRTWWSISALSSQSTCRSSNRSARWWENERNRARLKIKHAVGQRAGKDAERGIVGMKERPRENMSDCLFEKKHSSLLGWKCHFDLCHPVRGMLWWSS